MKVIQYDSASSSVNKYGWLRLFVFGKDEHERSLLNIEYVSGHNRLFWIAGQIGGDCLAEVNVHAFGKGLVVSIWSV